VGAAVPLGSDVPGQCRRVLRQTSPRYGQPCRVLVAGRTVWSCTSRLTPCAPSQVAEHVSGLQPDPIQPVPAVCGCGGLAEVNAFLKRLASRRVGALEKSLRWPGRTAPRRAVGVRLSRRAKHFLVLLGRGFITVPLSRKQVPLAKLRASGTRLGEPSCVSRTFFPGRGLPLEGCAFEPRQARPGSKARHEAGTW